MFSKILCADIWIGWGMTGGGGGVIRASKAHISNYALGGGGGGAGAGTTVLKYCCTFETKDSCVVGCEDHVCMII